MEPLDVIAALEQHADAAVQRLEPLYRLIDRPDELAFSDWLMLYALTIQHQPSLILDIGRGYGSPLCIFFEAAQVLQARVVSYDHAGGRWTTSLPKVIQAAEEAWFGRVTMVETDFVRADAKQLLDGPGRTLLFWDAHERRLAHHCVTQILPRLGTHDLVIVHDVSDIGSMLIQGVPRVRLFGSYYSPFNDLPVLYEFWQRHRTRVRSPARDAAAVMAIPSDRWARLIMRLPTEARPLIGRGGHWVYFSPGTKEQDTLTVAGPSVKVS